MPPPWRWAAAEYKDDASTQQTVAEQYVRANLGMNSGLLANLGEIEVQQGTGADQTRTFTVTAAVRNVPMLLGVAARDLEVSSTVEARQASTEVSLILPNTGAEGADNLAVLRRLGKDFARELIDDNDNTWLALVPYSQSVSVYDAEQPNRIRDWSTAAGLRPVELTSLFRSGYANLADARMPDRRSKILCMYRGLNRGENYFWDQAPSGQFLIYYRADIPSNDGNINPYTISWIGPNPEFGQATGTNDTRTLITDRGCPSAALLPLTNDLDKIDARLDAMSTRFNVNYAIAMGWGAMALAPAFQGDSGWALDDNLPKEFDDVSGDRLKAMVMLVNSTDTRWFDTDAYNAYVGEKIDGDSDLGGGDDSVVTQRFTNLCNSLRARHLRVFVLVTGNDEAQDEDGKITSASDFRRIAGAGLAACAQKSSDITYYTGADFVASESALSKRLGQIVDELHQESNFVRLIH
ncbi:MAG: hypothetical protein GAK45_00794 [Pseudomonas citronellolis]|nr:MAG: hypothetical protein GAK45_00794 [Pseudomonas citronellolis]